MGQETPTADNTDVFPFIDLQTADPERVAAMFQEAKSMLHGTLATYGGVNTDVFHHLMVKEDPNLIKPEVAAGEDEILGLRMPNVWFFSENPNNVGIALWYVGLQMKAKSETTDSTARDTYGTQGIVECYQISDLQRFAQDRNFAAFSVPYDLVLTARHITANISHLDEATENPQQLKFIHNILRYIASSKDISEAELVQQLESLEGTNLRDHLLTLMRGYWQNVLVLRGVQSHDEDIILADLQGKPKKESLELTREPFLVFLGGIDGASGKAEEDLIAQNLVLAKARYPKQTKIIVPQYEKADHRWHPSLTQQSPHETTTDGLILSLITLRELGYRDTFQRLRAAYQKLSG